MKLGLFKLSLGVSLAFHAVVFGVVKWAGNHHRPAALQQEREVMTLHLVAAPLSPSAPAAAVKVEVPTPPPAVPAPVVPPPPVQEPPPIEKVVEAQPMLPEPAVVPRPPSREPVATTIPKVEVQVENVTSSVSAVQGDGSSARPGVDTITSTARPGVLAQPNYLKNPEPVYPLQARRRHLQGTVLLEVKVSARGRAVEVSVKESSGDVILDEAALNAVRDWEFEPARVGRVSVESRIEVPVRFKLSR